MIDQNTAEEQLAELASARQFRFYEWLGKKFSPFKFASATEKGDIGEDFLVVLLERAGYANVEVVAGRRGDYDVELIHNGTTIKFEVKVATKDINGSFQFNGVRFDTKYSHLFCLGILPDSIKYLVVPKVWLNNEEGFSMVSMQRGANSAFKLTKRADQLHSFDQFTNDIENLLG